MYWVWSLHGSRNNISEGHLISRAWPQHGSNRCLFISLLLLQFKKWNLFYKTKARQSALHKRCATQTTVGKLPSNLKFVSILKAKMFIAAELHCHNIWLIETRWFSCNRLVPHSLYENVRFVSCSPFPSCELLFLKETMLWLVNVSSDIQNMRIHVDCLIS